MRRFRRIFTNYHLKFRRILKDFRSSVDESIIFLIRLFERTVDYSLMPFILEKAFFSRQLVSGFALAIGATILIGKSSVFQVFGGEDDVAAICIALILWMISTPKEDSGRKKEYVILILTIGFFRYFSHDWSFLEVFLFYYCIWLFLSTFWEGIPIGKRIFSYFIVFLVVRFCFTLDKMWFYDISGSSWIVTGVFWAGHYIILIVLGAGSILLNILMSAIGFIMLYISDTGVGLKNTDSSMLLYGTRRYALSDIPLFDVKLRYMTTAFLLVGFYYISQTRKVIRPFKGIKAIAYVRNILGKIGPPAGMSAALLALFSYTLYRMNEYSFPGPHQLGGPVEPYAFHVYLLHIGLALYMVPKIRGPTVHRYIKRKEKQISDLGEGIILGCFFLYWHRPYNHFLFLWVVFVLLILFLMPSPRTEKKIEVFSASIWLYIFLKFIFGILNLGSLMLPAILGLACLIINLFIYHFAEKNFSFKSLIVWMVCWLIVDQLFHIFLMITSHGNPVYLNRYYTWQTFISGFLISSIQLTKVKRKIFSPNSGCSIMKNPD